MGGTLRTKEGQERYEQYKEKGGLKGPCPLCKAESLRTFTHWRIIENEFPYDKIATVHHMILPLEHVSLDGISPEAWQELQEIKKSVLSDDYEFIIEGTPKKMTIPEHFHLHLVEIKN